MTRPVPIGQLMINFGMSTAGGEQDKPPYENNSGQLTVLHSHSRHTLISGKWYKSVHQNKNEFSLNLSFRISSSLQSSLCTMSSVFAHLQRQLYGKYCSKSFGFVDLFPLAESSSLNRRCFKLVSFIRGKQN